MPLKPGPGYWWNAQPSGQWSPVAFGPLSGPLALAAVEHAHVAARQRDPNAALLVDVAAARAEARQRHVVLFGQRLVRVLGRIDAHDGAGVAAQRAPHRAVGRARHHRIEGRADAHVLARLLRLAGLGVLVTLAVAVGVEHQRGPALRLLDVAGLVEHLGVDPADIAAAAAGAGPDRLVGVVAELQMMRAEAGLVGGVFAGLRIVHRHAAVGAVERELNGRRVRRALLAEVGLSGLWPVAASQTRPFRSIIELWLLALLSQMFLLAPIGRGPEDLDRAGVAGPERQRHVGRGRQHEIRRHVLDRVEDRHVVAGVLALPVQRPVAVDGRIAPVGRDQVVQILLVVVPVAQRDHDVALDALRPRRLCIGQLALRHALGPVAEILERHAAKLTGGDGDHVLAGLAGLDAAHPRLFVGLDRVHVELRNRAGRQLAELMAADAAVVLHGVEVVGDLDVVRRVLAAEYLGLRDLHHRVPVDRRVVLRGFRRIGGRHRGQIELLAGLALHLRRIDEAVAAHPDVVIGLRQVRDDVAALIVGDDDLDVAHRQIARFRDHPDAGLRTTGAFHHAADVVVVDGDRRGGRLLRGPRARPGKQTSPPNPNTTPKGM